MTDLNESLAADAPHLPGHQSIEMLIRRTADEVYAFAHQPQNFALWASGLGGELTRDRRQWRALGPEGWITVRFSPPNPYGVLDHWVRPDGADEIHIPLRVLPVGRNALVSLTLIRQHNTTDDAFARDVAWVRRDLDSLRSILEHSISPPA